MKYSEHMRSISQIISYCLEELTHPKDMGKVIALSLRDKTEAKGVIKELEKYWGIKK